MLQTTFDMVVTIRLDGESVSVQRAEDALVLLEKRWPDERGPSYDRAVSACVACVAGNGPGLAARATFCVAAMEAGLSFAVYEDPIEAMASEIAEIALAEIKSDTPPE